MKILIFVTFLLLVGCATNYQIIPVATEPPTNELEGVRYLLVPAQDTKKGTSMFLDIKNIEQGTIKSVSINGIKIGNFAAGEGLYMRFTNLIYSLSEKKWDRRWDRVYGAYRTICLIHVIIHVDLISGKSRNPHWSKDFWISEDNIGHGTIRISI